MLELQVESRQIGSPSRLSAIQLLRLAEVLKIAVIRQDLDLVFGALQKVSPFLESSDDRKHLFIVDLVVPFGIIQRLGEEPHWMILAIFPQLRQNGTGRKVRGISLQKKRSI